MPERELYSDSGPDKQFRDFLDRGEFYIQHCGDCNRHIFYPRLLCPHCGRAEPRWVQPSGVATVYSTSVPRDPGGAYNIALVELAEGPRLLTRVVDIDPEAVVIGMAVESFVGALDDDTAGKPLVLFRPVGGANSK